jgi:hypothetical protein
MRQPKVLAKRRTLTPLQEIGQLTANEIDTEWAGSWFHRRVIARKLQPACQVRYVRMARAIQNNGDMVRLTVDEDFAALPARVMKFSTDAGVPFLGGCAILELKYRGEAPALFKRLIEEFALNPQIASKYRLGIGALHPAGEQVEPFRAGVQAPHA